MQSIFERLGFSKALSDVFIDVMNGDVGFLVNDEIYHGAD
jgi:hypothetical protein